MNKSQPGPDASNADAVSPLVRVQGWYKKFRELVLGEEDEDTMRLSDLTLEELSADRRDTTVMVVGASGALGRIITRKLVLRGYRVKAMVRTLSQDIADAMGPKVEVVLGNVSNMSTMTEALQGVDKIICCVGTPDPTRFDAVFDQGISNVVQAFQKARPFKQRKMKVVKFQKDNPFAPGDTANWETSVTYGRFKPADDKADATGATPTGRGHFADRVDDASGRNQHVFAGFIYDAHVVTMSPEWNLDLSDFEGLIVRCSGDGKLYTLVLRTPAATAAGVTYEAEFRTRVFGWNTIRVPLSMFRAVDSAGNIRPDAPPLDKQNVKQIGFATAGRLRRDQGSFFLDVDYITAARRAEEPAFVLVSCATVNAYSLTHRGKQVVTATVGNAARSDVLVDPKLWLGDVWSQTRDQFRSARLKGERAVKKSGLPYTIVRAASLTLQRNSFNVLLAQDASITHNNTISITATADICIAALTSPNCVNVTVDACEVTDDAPMPDAMVTSDLSSDLSDATANDLFAHLKQNT